MQPLETSLQSIKKGNIRPVYLLSGKEYFFIEQFKQHLTSKLKEEIGGDVTTYDLKEIRIQDVLTDAETLPFFNEKKLLFAYHPIFLGAKQEKIAVHHDVDVLIKYLENPAPFTILVFIFSGDKLDMRKKITKQIQKRATIIDCAPIKDKELHQWIYHLAKQHNIVLTEDATLLLESEFGTNLYILQKEIEKLAFYIGKNREVTKEIASDVISSSLTQNTLDLVDSVLKGDLTQAIKIYKDLQKMKEDPIGMIALLAYQFRMIFQVKLLHQKGYSRQKIQSEVKAHPYVVKLAVERSKVFSSQSLSYIIDELTKTDALIKQGKMNKDLAFEMLLYRLTVNE